MAEKDPGAAAHSEDRRGSPDDLDRLIRIVNPSSWMLLAALIVPLLALTLWGFVGRVRTTVGGQGIILGGAIYDVAPMTAGRLTRLLVDVGDEVGEGELLAELELPELELERENARAGLALLREEHGQLLEFSRRDVEIEQAYLRKQRAIADQSIRDQEAHIVVLVQQLEADTTLLESGLISPQELVRSKQSLVAAREAVQQARAQLTQLQSTELKTELATQRARLDSERGIAEAERALAQLEREGDKRAHIVSPCSGRILELLVQAGSTATAGQPLLRIARPPGSREPLRVVFYVRGDDGKRIKPEMTVHVAPVTSQVEEHGYVVGRVERVGEYPASAEAMRLTLKNDALVSELAGVGLPFEVVATLDFDPAAPSGHVWTSGRGPDVLLSSGTPAAALVVVATRRPIELVLPPIRRLFDGDR